MKSDEETEDEVCDSLSDTIAFFAGRGGVTLMLRRRKKLLARIVSVGRSSSKTRPLSVLVEYPLGTGIVWRSLSAAGRQAYLDACFIEGYIPPFFLQQDGVSAGPQDWDYLSTDARAPWKALASLLTPDVRSGRSALTCDTVNAPLFDPKYTPPTDLKCRTKLLPEPTHLISAFEDLTPCIRGERDWEPYRAAAMVVKRSTGSAVKRKKNGPHPREKKIKVIR